MPGLKSGPISEAKTAAAPIRQTLPNPAATWGHGQARSTEAAAGSSEEPVVAVAGSGEGPAVACTGAAMVEENTWDAREAEPSCAGPERWAAAAIASAEPAARQEWPPPDGLVRCMKLRARACWLASPDWNPVLDDRRTAIPGRYRRPPAACRQAQGQGRGSWNPRDNRGAKRNPWLRLQSLNWHEAEQSAWRLGQRSGVPPAAPAWR